ncbi:MAG: hypothetical protein IKX20_03150 [Paludibacteraceae bacterium]|nr:hypothetical protein [Paludibacteraceae bacterium]
MNIEKYGFTSSYGYGCLRESLVIGDRINPNVLIVAKSKVYSKWVGKRIKAKGIEEQTFVMGESPFSGAYSPKTGFSGVFSSKNSGIGIFLNNRSNDKNVLGRQDLFVVLNGDDRKWHEYFTGIELPEASDPFMIHAHEIGFSSDLIVEAEKGKVIGHKNVSICNINICDALSFSERVKNFSDNEIREMVRQFNVMRQDARKWGEVYDRAINTVLSERDKLDKGLSSVKSDVEAGFGKYGQNADKTNDSSVKKTSAINPGFVVPREIQKLWIKQGKCMYCGGEVKKNELVQNQRTCYRCGRTFFI